MTENPQQTPHGFLAGAGFTFDHTKVVQAVRAPLGFFALALAIVEVFLLGAAIFAPVSDWFREVLIILGTVMFVLIVLGVFALAAWRPQSLVFTEESHLRWHQISDYGNSNSPIPGPVLDAMPAVASPIEAGGQIAPPSGGC